MKVEQNLEENQIWIGQPALIERLLEDFQWTNLSLLELQQIQIRNYSRLLMKKSAQISKSINQSLVGSLSICQSVQDLTITFAVSTLANFSVKPAQRHWTAAKCVLRYLRGNTRHGVIYRKEDKPDLSVFLMQIEQEIKMTEDQPQATFFKLEAVPYLEEQETRLHSPVYCRGRVCGTKQCYSGVCLAEETLH